jgi:hypothetical protein|eukprot:scaffold433_cov260-Chaetoceros_neogracile.AAC.26
MSRLALSTIFQALSILQVCYGFAGFRPRYERADANIALFSSTSPDTSSSISIISSSSSSSGSNINDNAINQATSTLNRYDQLQAQYMKENPIGLGGGTASLQFVQTKISPDDREQMRTAVVTLANEAHRQRALNSAEGRIILGICAENVDEALLGLKTWVPALALPRGLLHGMDVDGKPIAPEDLGSVYVKYNTSGCMTFTQMRKSGLGFDALWKPGDCVLETYDGDFRGIYFNVELNDGEFRQFGILPTDLFLEEEEW